MDSQLPGQQDLDQLVDKAANKTKQLAGAGAKKVGSAALKGAGKMARKAAAKAVKKVASKLTKNKVTNAIVNMVKAIIQLISKMFNLIFGVIGSGGGILIIIGVVAFIALSGTANKREEDVVLDSGSIYEVNADWQERLLYSFYSHYSDRAYFYTMDEDSTIHQGDYNTMYDKYQREQSFTLSTSLLKYLDEQLNDDHYMPEQFIKPVFNTCSTGEASNGLCKYKSLTNKDGVLQAPSQSFTKNSNKNFEVDKDEYESGVWDWGFAPIIHYKSFEEKSWIPNKTIQNIQYWDEEAEEYKTCSKLSKCPQEVQDDINDKEKDLDKRVDLGTKKVYLIDQVATFMGTIKNSVGETEQDTGEDQIETKTIEKTTKNKDLINKGVVKEKNKDKFNEILSDGNILKTVVVKDLVKIHYLADNANLQREYFLQLVNDYVKNNNMQLEGNVTIDNIIKNEIKSVTTGDYFLDKQIQNGMTYINPRTGEMFCGSMSKYNSLCSGKAIQFEVQLYEVKTVASCNVIEGLKPDGKGTVKCDGKEIQLTAVDDENIGYAVDDNYVSGVNKIILDSTYSINYQSVRPTTYDVKGDIWSNSYDYITDTPEILDFNNGDYLYEYINYYEYYEPIDDYMLGFDFEDVADIISNKEDDGTYSDQDQLTPEQLQRVKKFDSLLVNLYGEKILNALDLLYSVSEDVDKDYEGDEVQINEEEEENKIVEGIGIKHSSSLSTFIQNYNQLYPQGHPEKLSDLHQHIESLLNKYDIPKELFIAIASQESSMNHYGNIPESESQWKAGAGLMQIESTWNGKTITARDRWGTVTSAKVTYDKVIDIYDNIQFGIMILRASLDEWPGNILMGIQSYNKGYGGVATAVKAYAEDCNEDWQNIVNNPNDLGWSNPVYLGLSSGDSNYLPNVLQYLPENYNLTINYSTKGSVTIRIDENLKLQSAASSNSIQQLIYWGANRKIIEKNWNVFYPNKSEEAANITLKDNKVVYDTSKEYYYTAGAKSLSGANIQLIIAAMFAEDDGGALTDYMEVTEEMWRNKFSDMFSGPTGTKLTLKSKDFGDYFNTTPVLPLEDVTVITRPYGMVIVEDKTSIYKKQIYENIVQVGAAKQAVRTVANGTIAQISKNSITIQHTALSASSQHKVIETMYEEIDVKEGLKVGDIVTAADTIGYLMDEEGAGFGFSLIVDGAAQDPTWIIHAAKEYIDYSKQFTNYTAAGETNEASKAIQQYILEHADEIEEEYFDYTDSDLLEDTILFDPSNVTLYSTVNNKVTITSVAWTRHAGDATQHQGIDVAPTTAARSYDNTGLFTFARGIIVSFYDGFPSIGSRYDYSQNWGFGNYIQVLYRGNDGNWYLILYAHAKQNGQMHLVGYVDQLPVVEAGTRIGTIGSSGSSSGYHTHIQIINLGNQPLKTIMEQYIGKYGTAAITNWNMNYRVPGNRCENNATTPCWIKPDTFFNVKDGGWYTGSIMND